MTSPAASENTHPARSTARLLQPLWCLGALDKVQGGWRDGAGEGPELYCLPFTTLLLPDTG